MRLIVTGMHRSGTSLLAKLLAESGFFIGKDSDFDPADSANPKGYWEHKEFRAVNEMLLSGSGADWNRPHEYNLDNLPEDDVRIIDSTARKAVDCLDQQDNWLIKDPRMCLTLPFWKKFIPDACVIAIYRDPMQVAESLRNRDSYPIQYGLAIWEYYTRSLIRHTSEMNFAFISHSELINNPGSTLEQITKLLACWGGTKFAVPSEFTLNKIFDSQLFRARAEGLNKFEFMTKEQVALDRAIADKKNLAIAWASPAPSTRELISGTGALILAQKEDIDTLNSVLNERESEIKNAKIEITSKNKELKLLRKERSNAFEMARNFEEKNYLAAEYSESLKKEIEKVTEYAESLEAEVSKKERNLAALALYNQQQEENIRKITGEKEKIGQELSEIIKYTKLLDTELSSLHGRPIKDKHVYQSLAVVDDESSRYVISLEKELQNINGYVKSLKQHITSKEEDLKEFYSQINHLELKLDEASKYAVSMNAELQKVTEYAQSLKSSLSIKEGEIDKLTTRIQSQDDKIQEITNYAKSLENLKQ